MGCDRGDARVPDGVPPLGGACWGLWQDWNGKNGAMECPNIGVHRGMCNTVKLEKGKMSRAVRSYADVTREDLQTPLGENRLIIP